MVAEPSIRRLTRPIARAVRLRCPRCGRGPLFRGWFSMVPACGSCGLRFERAPGYFVGAIYVNYAVTTVLVVGGYLLLWSTTTLSTAAQLALWTPVTVLLPLVFFRWSRSLWLALEYLVNPDP